MGSQNDPGPVNVVCVPDECNGSDGRTVSCALSSVSLAGLLLASGAMETVYAKRHRAPDPPLRALYFYLHRSDRHCDDQVARCNVPCPTGAHRPVFHPSQALVTFDLAPHVYFLSLERRTLYEFCSRGAPLIVQRTQETLFPRVFGARGVGDGSGILVGLGSTGNL